ncbi:hypothetical protein ECANGB1_1105 [Enterospora canceri]|uniref:Uncharacterized protein n=1 Tax=Enterospora canceri TaxID=1081671 RepID=A0A1Y1S7H2_9MICR|nr:hypothetical protein ECANGB1_1105 [Enterospora canceri]
MKKSVQDESTDNQTDDSVKHTLQDIKEILKQQSLYIMSLSQSIDVVKKSMQQKAAIIDSIPFNGSQMAEDGFNVCSSTSLSQKLSDLASGCRYKLAHVEGLPRMRINQLKVFIADICNIEREAVANIGYINDEAVEIVIAVSAIPAFTAGIRKRSEFIFLDSAHIIMADREGVLKRLKRVESDKVKNSDLKKMFKNLQEVLTTEKADLDKIRATTINSYLDNED